MNGSPAMDTGAPLVVLGRERLTAKLDDLARLRAESPPELATATRLDLRFRGQAVLDGPPQGGAATAAAARGRATPSNTRPAG